MNRRDFLQTTAGGLVAVISLPVIAAVEASRNEGFELPGVSGFSAYLREHANGRLSFRPDPRISSYLSKKYGVKSEAFNVIINDESIGNYHFQTEGDKLITYVGSIPKHGETPTMLEEIFYFNSEFEQLRTTPEGTEDVYPFIPFL